MASVLSLLSWYEGVLQGTREESHHELPVRTKTERLETTQPLQELKCFSIEIVRKDASF